jgi:hypothetical protein
LTPKVRFWQSIIEPHSILGLSTGGGALPGPGDEGGPESFGGPQGQLKSQGVKCVRGVRQSVVPIAYSLASCILSSSVIFISCKREGSSGLPAPILSICAIPFWIPSILTTTPLTDGIQPAFKRS